MVENVTSLLRLDPSLPWENQCSKIMFMVIQHSNLLDGTVLRSTELQVDAVSCWESGTVMPRVLFKRIMLQFEFLSNAQMSDEPWLFHILLRHLFAMIKAFTISSYLFPQVGFLCKFKRFVKHIKLAWYVHWNSNLFHVTVSIAKMPSTNNEQDVGC